MLIFFKILFLKCKEPDLKQYYVIVSYNVIAYFSYSFNTLYTRIPLIIIRNIHTLQRFTKYPHTFKIVCIAVSQLNKIQYSYYVIGFNSYGSNAKDHPLSARTYVLDANGWSEQDLNLDGDQVYTRSRLIVSLSTNVLALCYTAVGRC